MSAQDIIFDSHLTRVRELKTALEKAHKLNAELQSENAALKAHFDLALLAAQDLSEGELEIWDGWNLILGSPKMARDRADLVAQAKKTGRRIWIVLDGHDENVETDGLVRLSYTGGAGEHRADRLITAFVRMAAYRGLADRIRVRTNDKDFLREILRLGAARALAE